MCSPSINAKGNKMNQKIVIDFERNKNIIKNTSKNISKNNSKTPKKSIHKKKDKKESGDLVLSTPSFHSKSPTQIPNKSFNDFGKGNSDDSLYSLSSDSPPKKKGFFSFKKREKVDEIAKLESDVNEKMELLRKKIEEKKILQEKKILEEEQKRKDLNKKESSSDSLLYISNQRISKVLTFPKKSSDSSDSFDIPLLPFDIEGYKCPKCSSKMKKKWVKRHDKIYIQTIKCKNKECRFEKELRLKI